MSCSSIIDQLYAYLHGELSTARATVIEAHLAHCGACRAEAERLRRSMRALRRPVTSQMTPEISAAIVATLAAQTPSAPRLPVIRWALAAATVALIGVTAACWRSQPATEAHHPSLPAGTRPAPAVLAQTVTPPQDVSRPVESLHHARVVRTVRTLDIQHMPTPLPPTAPTAAVTPRVAHPVVDALPVPPTAPVTLPTAVPVPTVPESVVAVIPPPEIPAVSPEPAPVAATVAATDDDAPAFIATVYDSSSDSAICRVTPSASPDGETAETTTPPNYYLLHAPQPHAYLLPDNRGFLQ